MIRNTKQDCWSLTKPVFTYQDTVWFMNEQTNKWVKRLNTVLVKTKLTVYLDYTLWLYPQPKGHHMRGKTIQISSFQVKIMP